MAGGMSAMPEVSTAIALRKLELGNDDFVEVFIWAPEERADHEHRCEFQITGLATVVFSYAIGGDSIQALMLAFEKIGVELYSSEGAKSGALRWNGESNLGFPVPKGLEDLVPEV
jgi:hypothetical protein